MNNFIISACSTADLPLKFFKEHNIPCLYYSFIINDKVYSDDLGTTMSYEEFYNRIDEGAMPTTSQVNVDTYVNTFEPYLKDGLDILHLSFSSGLSGSCGSAFSAAEILKEKYPDRKIYVIDTLAASLGYGLLVNYAVSKKDAGEDIDKIYNWINENKLNLNHWFTVNDLQHLKRGGRLGSGAALLGTLLHIKPVLHVDNKGKLIPVSKTAGRKKSLNELVSRMEEMIVNPDGQEIFISHSNCIEDANYVAERIKSHIPGIKRVFINMIGPVIGSHTGIGTVAVFFLGKNREEFKD
ncbi:MAG: DegV family protein [Eubacteriales bacterium]